MHQAFKNKFTGQIILQCTNLGKLPQQICTIPTFAEWLYQAWEAIILNPAVENITHGRITFICVKQEFHE